MNHRPREKLPGRNIVISGDIILRKYNVATMQSCIMRIFQTIYLFFDGKFQSRCHIEMVFSLACCKHAKGFGESALLGLQVLQVFNNERVILLRGKHFGALPSRLLAALAKQNKRFVSSRKHVERTTTWRKERYPLHNSF